MGKGPRKLSSNKINQDEKVVASSKQHVRAACPKDKLEFKLFFECLVMMVIMIIKIMS